MRREQLENPPETPVRSAGSDAPPPGRATRIVPAPSPPGSGRARPGDDLLGRSLALVRFLRDGCPWDARQTPESLRPYLLEEAHETADAVLAGDDEELGGELGDLLLNVAFQIVLAEERGAFGAREVVRRLEAKMEARHPHVYGDADEPPDWEELKARERAAAPDASPDAEAARDDPERDAGGDAEARSGGAPDRADRPRAPDDGPPAGLGPLSRALRVQQRAAALGFAWPSAGDALAKLREEVGELEEALERRSPATARPEASGADDGGTGSDGATAGTDDALGLRGADRAAGAGGTVPDDELEEEVGDVLLAAVTVARHASVHPMVALSKATRTFERRFRELARRADAEGLDLGDASLDELEALWRRVKEGETREDG